MPQHMYVGAGLDAGYSRVKHQNTDLLCCMPYQAANCVLATASIVTHSAFKDKALPTPQRAVHMKSFTAQIQTSPIPHCTSMLDHGPAELNIILDRSI